MNVAYTYQVQTLHDLSGSRNIMAEASLISADSDSSWRRNTKQNHSGSQPWRQRDVHVNGKPSSSYADLPTEFASSRGNYERFTRNDYEKLEKAVHNHFSKEFSFQPPSDNWELPDPGVMFKVDKWEVDQFQEIKQELNDVKNKLNDYNLDDWHKHTRSMNKAGEIQWKLRKEFDPEFVTQAWCKFYENAKAFPLVPAKAIDTKSLLSVHLCEAPGAFITSLNHYLKLHHPEVKWQWIASTLNPYYEGNPLSNMINDDRFILQTLDNWYFGQDFTGDLMNLKNMRRLFLKTKDMGDVLLVTADGSIDCQEDPGEQESIVSNLHYCEAVTALQLLAPGGSFLLKMFTMYEYQTICLMYLLCCSFKEVRVFKPATSKEGNSEVYVVCLEYHGRKHMQPWLEVLRKNFGPQVPEEAMFPVDCIPEDFFCQLHECANMFKNFQVEVIENNIWTYKKGRNQFIRKLRFMISNHFMKVYDMKKIEDQDGVVGKSKLEETETLNLDPRTEEGSFSDRCRKKNLRPLDQLQYIKEDLENMDIKWPFKEDIKWLKFPRMVQGFKIITGKPVTTVHSSKFCLGRLLKMRNQVRQIAKSNPSPASPSSQESEHDSVPTYRNLLIHSMKDSNYVRNTKVLNFKETLWSSMEAGHNEVAELDAFSKIMDAIDTLWRDQNLFIQGYPMLTQFNVGIIYMLSHMFTKVGFIKPYQQDFAVIFEGYNSFNQKMFKFLQDVDEKFDELQEAGGVETVLSVMPIYQLCGKHPDPVDTRQVTSRSESGTNNEDFAESVSKFYTCVTEVNHLCVKEQILDIIANIRL